MDNVFIEHLWRSLKYDCVDPHAFQTGLALHAGLVRWVGHDNTHRPHSALAERTNGEAYDHSGQTIRATRATSQPGRGLGRRKGAIELRQAGPTHYASHGRHRDKQQIAGHFSNEEAIALETIVCELMARALNVLFESDRADHPGDDPTKSVFFGEAPSARGGAAHRRFVLPSRTGI